MLVIDTAKRDRLSPHGMVARVRAGQQARQFTEQVRATVVAGQLDAPVTIVLEGQAKGEAEEAVADGVEVVSHTPGEGDDTIAASAAAHDRGGRGHGGPGVDRTRRPGRPARGGRADLAARPAGGLNPGRGAPGAPRAGKAASPVNHGRASAPRRARSAAGVAFRELVHNRRGCDSRSGWSAPRDGGVEGSSSWTMSSPRSTCSAV